jgi:hypothetical protein
MSRFLPRARREYDVGQCFHANRGISLGFFLMSLAAR